MDEPFQRNIKDFRQPGQVRLRNPAGPDPALHALAAHLHQLGDFDLLFA
jgi:hypothetical protein